MRQRRGTKEPNHDLQRRQLVGIGRLAVAQLAEQIRDFLVSERALRASRKLTIRRFGAIFGVRSAAARG
jgi:hypothetical protein